MNALAGKLAGAFLVLEENVMLNDLSKIREIDLAYFAGILDGEGCIRITKPSATQWNYFCLIVEISNTDCSLIDWIRDTFGGSVSPGRKRGSYREIWTWKIVSCEAEDLLKAIVPYLIVKKSQANLGLHFRESFDRGVNSNQKLPQSVVEFRTECFHSMKELKRA